MTQNEIRHQQSATRHTNDLPATKKSSKGSCLAMIVIGGIAGLGLLAVSIPGYSRAGNPGMRQVSNTRQIVLALKTFAIDHDGDYPHAGKTYERWRSDGTKEEIEVLDATSAFNVLVPEYMPNDKIFWTPIGDSQRPNGDENLTQGENHWALTDGLSDSSSGSYPLVFTPFDDADPLPIWRHPTKDREKPGHAWADGRKLKAIIAYNDGSAATESLGKDGKTLPEDQIFDFLKNEESNPQNLRLLNP